MANNPVDPSGKSADVAVKMKEALQAAEISANNLKSSFDQQLKIVTQLRNVMAEVASIMSSSSKEAVQQGSILSEDTWKKVEKKINDTSSAQKKYNGIAEKTARVLKAGVSAAANVAVAAIEGLEKGFSNLYSISKSVMGILGGTVKSLFSFGKALVLAPFRAIDYLFNLSKKASDTSLATAIENVREQFGSLKSESSRTVIDVAKGMGKLNDTGVSAYRIFGTVAQRVEAVNKMATAMGATFQVFGKEIMANGEAIMRYNKGLGITDEQMAFIASTAMRMGKDIAQVQNEMTKQALGMSKAFGVNAKVISRDMAKAMQDLAHFGHLSTKEIAVAATFANKLGVSVDKLTGILDATKTFDNTAEQVSKLNEQFNLNLDAQEIMLEENPAAALAKIQGAFAAAGHDVSKMNRFQRELIKSTGFMSDELLNASLSTKGMGVSFDKVSKQGDKNEQKVMSQTEAMKELADSMKRIVQAGQTTKGGILDHIIEGFTRGIESAPEFIRLMENMNRILVSALEFGVKLGKDFVEFFPGVKDMIGGLADIFDPQRYQNMFNGVLKAFDVFKAGGSGKMEDFMARLEVIFDEFFKAGSPGMNRMIKGIQAFGGAIIAGVSKLIVWVTDELAKALPKMFEFLLNPKMALKKPDAGPWAKMLAPLGDAIMRAIDTLGPILEKGFTALWDKYWPKIQKWLETTWPKVAPVIAGILFGPAVINVLITAAGPMLLSALGNVFKFAFKGLGKGISSLFSMIGPPIAEFFGSVGSTFMSGAGKLATKIGPQFLKALPFVGAAVMIADAGINVSKAIKEFSGTLEKQGFEPATAKIAAGTTGLINTLTLGLLPKDLQQQIATAVAEMADKLFKTLEKFFGESFVKDAKRYFSGLFDVFGGIGDLLMSIFKGDEAGIEASLIKIGKGLWDMMVTNFTMSIKILLTLPTIIWEYLSKALGWVFDKVGEWFLSLKDLPILGPIFELFGKVFKDIGSVFKDLGDIFKNLREMIKKIDVMKIFTDIWNYLSSKIMPILKSLEEFFISLGRSIADFSKALWGAITAVGSAIADAFTTIGKFFADIGKWLWDKLSPIATEITRFFSERAYAIWDILTTPFKSIVKFFKDLFDGGVMEAFTNLGNNIKSFGLKVFDFLTWPIRKAWEVIKSVFNWDTMKEVFFNVVAGIKEALGKIADFGPFKALISVAKKVFKIESPSKVFAEIGEHVHDGFMSSVEKIPKSTQETFKEANTVASKEIKSVAAQATTPVATITGSLSSPKSTIGAIDEADQIIKKLNEVKEATEKKNLVDTLNTITNNLYKLTNAGGGQRPLQDLMGSIKSISLVATPAEWKEAIGSLKLIGTAIHEIIELNNQFSNTSLESFIKISTNVGKLATAEATRQVTTSIKAVTEMVKTIQQLDDALSKLPTVNMEAKLEKLAASSGLGAGGVYTVKSREVVMNFDIKITMDAGKLEEVMIFRKESIIRDRLNYALGDGSGANQVANNISLRLNDRRPTPIASNVD